MEKLGNIIRTHPYIDRRIKEALDIELTEKFQEKKIDVNWKKIKKIIQSKYSNE